MLNDKPMGIEMKILTFSPYSFINVHAYPEAIVADNFRTRGHEIIQVRCKGLYADFCISMSAVGLSPRSTIKEKEAICTECNSRRELLEKEFGFKTVYIDDYITDEMLEDVKINLEQVNQDNWTDFCVSGLPISRYASIEYILNEKINTIKFDPYLWGGYITHVKNALLTLYAGQKLVNEIKTEVLIAYNTIYSCNHIMCCLFDKMGKPHYTLHAGAHHKYMRSEITIFKGLKSPYLINRSTAWKRYSTRPLSKKSIDKALEHVEELLDAKSPWVYTVKSENRSSASLREFFDIEEKQKVLLVTMASGDERFSLALADAKPDLSTEPLFPTQLAWVQNLIDWARERPDIFLIVRVHPREFPNKREQVLSHQAHLLRETLVNLPHNVRVNWPDDLLSIHDIAKITNVCVNATSTAGLEMLLLGIPVVIYDPGQLFSYPPELNIFAKSVEEYFVNIDMALNAGRSAKHIIGALRWIAFKSDIIAIDIGEAYCETRKLDDIMPVAKRYKNIFRKFLHSLRKKPVNNIKIATFSDPWLRSEMLGNLKQTKWLAYAVENQTDSHIEAYCDLFVKGTEYSLKDEFEFISKGARKYLQRLGISDEIFDDVSK